MASIFDLISSPGKTLNSVVSTIKDKTGQVKSLLPLTKPKVAPTQPIANIKKYTAPQKLSVTPNVKLDFSKANVLKETPEEKIGVGQFTPISERGPSPETQQKVGLQAAEKLSKTPSATSSFVYNTLSGLSKNVRDIVDKGLEVGFNFMDHPIDTMQGLYSGFNKRLYERVGNVVSLGNKPLGENIKRETGKAFTQKSEISKAAEPIGELAFDSIPLGYTAKWAAKTLAPGIIEPILQSAYFALTSNDGERLSNAITAAGFVTLFNYIAGVPAIRKDAGEVLDNYLDDLFAKVPAFDKDASGRIVAVPKIPGAGPLEEDIIKTAVNYNTKPSNVLKVIENAVQSAPKGSNPLDHATITNNVLNNFEQYARATGFGGLTDGRFTMLKPIDTMPSISDLGVSIPAPLPKNITLTPVSVSTPVTPKVTLPETQKMIDTFGITTDINQGGYLTPQGELINLSKGGAQKGITNHRDALSMASVNEDSFMNEGNLQIEPIRNDINVTFKEGQKITPEQSHKLDILSRQIAGTTNYTILDKSGNVIDQGVASNIPGSTGSISSILKRHSQPSPVVSEALETDQTGLSRIKSGITPQTETPRLGSYQIRPEGETGKVPSTGMRRWEDRTDEEFVLATGGRVLQPGDISEQAAIKQSGMPLYHGTDEYAKKMIEKEGFKLGEKSNRKVGPTTGVDRLGQGIYFATTKDEAKFYTPSRTTEEVVSANLKPGAKIKEFDSYDKWYNYVKKNDSTALTNPNKLNKLFESKGYDGVRVGTDIVIFDPKNIVVNKAETMKEPTKELSPLLAEAKKYSTPEEFMKAQFSKKPAYGMSHRPTYEGMPPASNLLEGDAIPGDVYQHPEWSIASGHNMKTDKAAMESWRVLQQIRNNPEQEVTVYRATRRKELNSGDWITFSKEYAKDSIEPNTPEKVYSFKIKAKDAIFAGDDINEFGYYPTSDLTSIWNQAHGKTPTSLPTATGGTNETDNLTWAKGVRAIGIQKAGLRNYNEATKILEKYGALPKEIKVGTVTKDYIKKYYETQKDPVVGDVFVNKKGERIEITKIEDGKIRYFLNGKNKGIEGTIYIDNIKIIPKGVPTKSEYEHINLLTDNQKKILEEAKVTEKVSTISEQNIPNSFIDEARKYNTPQEFFGSDLTRIEGFNIVDKYIRNILNKDKQLVSAHKEYMLSKGPQFGSSGDSLLFEKSVGAWQEKYNEYLTSIWNQAHGKGGTEVLAEIKKPVRFEIGKKLTEPEKQEVLKSLSDSYKTKRRPYTVEDIDGIEKRVYTEDAGEYMVTSDITGKKLRYYVTLPDGKIAHPTEVYGNISKGEIDSMANESDIKDAEYDSLVKYLDSVGEKQKAIIAVKKAIDNGAKITNTGIRFPGQSFSITIPEYIRNTTGSFAGLQNLDEIGVKEHNILNNADWKRLIEESTVIGGKTPTSLPKFTAEDIALADKAVKYWNEKGGRLAERGRGSPEWAIPILQANGKKLPYGWDTFAHHLDYGKPLQLPSAEFSVGDVLDPQGKTNMVGQVTIRDIVGNTLKFIDSNGTEYYGMQKSLVRDLIKGGSWKRVEVLPTTDITGKQIDSIGDGLVPLEKESGDLYKSNVVPEEPTDIPLLPEGRYPDSTGFSMLDKRGREISQRRLYAKAMRKEGKIAKPTGLPTIEIEPKYVELQLQEPQLDKYLDKVVKISYEAPKVAQSVMGSLKNRLISDWDTYLHPVDLADKIAGMGGKWTNAARLAQASGGGKAGIAVRNKELVVRDLVRNKIDYKDLDTYLVANRQAGLAAKGIEKGVNTALARKQIDQLKLKYGDNFGKLEQSADLIYSEYNKLVDELVDSGSISEKLGDYLKNTEPNYVPYVREFIETGEMPVSRGGEVIKRIKGSERAIISPLQTFDQIMNKGYEQAAQNRFKRDFLEEAKDLEVLNPFISKELSASGKNQISYKVNGETKTLQLDPELFNPLSGLPTHSQNIILQALRTGASIVRTTATGLNPEFGMVSNFSKDFVEQKIGNADTVGGASFGEIMQARKSIKDYQQGLETEGAKLYEQALSDGALISKSHAEMRFVINKKLEDIVFENQDGLFIKSVKNPKLALRSLLDNYEQIAERVEDATRFASYKKAIDNGYTREQAAIISRDATTDFLRTGEKMKELNSVYAFLNAGYQGAKRLYTKAAKNPKDFSLGIAKYIVAPTLAIMAWNYMADPEQYKSINPELRKRYWAIVIPGFRPIFFPKPWIFNALAYNIESIGDNVMFGTPIDWVDMAGTYIEALNPIQFGGTLIETLLPTGLKPIAQVSTGKTWYGGPIKPDYPYGTAPSPKYQYFTNKPPKDIYMGVANILDWIGNTTGVNAIKQSPADLQNIVEGYTSGVGRMAGSTIQTIENAVGGKVELSTTPFFEVFFKNITKPQDDAISKAEYYKLKGETDVKAADIKFEQKQRLNPIVESLLEDPSKAGELTKDLSKEDRKTVTTMIKSKTKSKMNELYAKKYPKYKPYIDKLQSNDPTFYEDIQKLSKSEQKELSEIIKILTP